MAMSQLHGQGHDQGLAQAQSQAGMSSKENVEPLPSIQRVVEAALSTYTTVSQKHSPTINATAGSADGSAYTEDGRLASAQFLDEYHTHVANQLYLVYAAQWKWNGGAGESAFSQPAIDGKDPLTFLDPHTHSLAYLYILTARLNRLQVTEDLVARRRQDEFIRVNTAWLVNFTTNMDGKQCSNAPERAHQFSKGLAKAATIIGDPGWALPLMSNFLKHLVRDPADLSSIYPVFLFQCLEARDYARAYDLLLQHDVSRASKKAFHLVYTDVLEYFYYGGLVLTKLGRLERASDFFESCLSVPSQELSAIQVDAFKKRMLVQLIKDGKTTHLPNYTSKKVRNVMRMHAGPYIQFANAYASKMGSRASEARALTSKHASIFQEDGNAGLVQQCLLLHRQRRIQNLSKMFSAIPLSDVHMLLGEGDALTLDVLQQEINDATTRGWIAARFTNVLDGPSPLVYFDPISSEAWGGTVLGNDSTFSETTRRKLMEAMENVQYWQKRVEEEERRLARSDGFLTKLACRTRGDAKYGFEMMTDMDEDSAFDP
ncbi:hypothetical protein K437DRAFT_260281 [Tilletiaria anomala UBC 951]|uniref:COP9 signalosome complex subunit 3 N-terminal helical repeats domain-containing protein n=1 Tax=Tilletiaria anomala (strain ATCC 24038 / CBS 436.72 / UBC 951) TaxID=1037660 RepID=A0A066VAW9_TILAU|nr:uncharacterized protein K437DRAFT_260281 [Tilletiaria anomala UBC 951]KDN35894.1 hypothetical protein K437DRAFT_260281 [Tilletiaria anomala UBC 951]